MLSELAKNKYVKGIVLGIGLITAGCSNSETKSHQNYMAKTRPTMVNSQKTGTSYFLWNMDNDKNGYIDLVTKNVEPGSAGPIPMQEVVTYDSSAIGTDFSTWRGSNYMLSKNTKVMTPDERDRFTITAMEQRRASQSLEGALGPNNK
ncbi:MAG: hypothetical protein WC755_02525 [Candidatus Woesearchaeota archaeon]|jgi:hypothetical protein